MAEKHDTKAAKLARPTAEQLNEVAAARTEPGAALTQDGKLAQVTALLRGTGLEDDPAPGSADEPGDGAAAEDTPAPGSADEPGEGTPAEGAEGEAEGEGEPAAPETIDQLADRLGLSRDELNRIAVKVGPDTLTLGELKAKLPALAKLEANRVELDDRIGQWELTKIDTERQILAVVDSFPPGSVPAAVLAAVEQRHNRERHKQAALLNSARPSWGDPKYAEAQRLAINSAMSKYGFSPSELSTVVDHRHVLAMQDFAALLEKVEKLKGAGQRVNESHARPLANRSAVSNGTKPAQTRRSEVAERVAGLLRRGSR